jgi:hypothetical protein
MLRSAPHLLIAAASLALAIFMATAGARPHQLYADTWGAPAHAGSRR